MCIGLQPQCIMFTHALTTWVQARLLECTLCGTPFENSLEAAIGTECHHQIIGENKQLGACNISFEPLVSNLFWVHWKCRSDLQSPKLFESTLPGGQPTLKPTCPVSEICYQAVISGLAVLQPTISSAVERDAPGGAPGPMTLYVAAEWPSEASISHFCFLEVN